MYTFQDIVAKLNGFWASQDCLILHPYDTEKGAGTFNPATFLRSLGPEPFRCAYIEPCRRPKDGRYGSNPNRLQHYFQYQVILKPSPYNIQDLYLQSLTAVGLPLDRHDIRFVHDDWESPTLGASGLGWEVWIDGQECSQFTYFQTVAGLPLKPITGEITYGIERLAMYLQNVDSIFDIQWNKELTYGDLYHRNEIEYSQYNFEASDPKALFQYFDDAVKETKRLVQKNLPLPAYDQVIKASHFFNLLDARGSISVTERARYIASIRDIAKEVAVTYIESREAQQFPLTGKFPKPEQVQPPYKKVAIKKQKADSFLLEIGCEELPHSFIEPALQNLKRSMEALLREHGVSFGKMHAMATPRRLALLIEQLQPEVPEVRQEKKGPSLENSYNSDGSLKPAAEGFFRSLKIGAKKRDELPADGVFIKDNYLFASITTPALSTADLLQEKLTDLILDLDFPKKMRWADLDIQFARPIRWIVALYGSDTLHFQLGPIVSSNVSMGHRQLSGQPCLIPSADQYKETLRTHHVLVDIEERKKEIEDQLSHIENSSCSTVVAKEKVLSQVLYLVEWPFLTVATFDPNFLQAPKEVLISEMVEHQKYFPLLDSQSNLKNQFVITANTKPTDSIRKGNQKVISARLSDGVFLYNQDLKTALETRLEKLKNSTFQKGLGSLFDKVERMGKLIQYLKPFFPDCPFIERACLLSKADLASEMVGEFPELQGTVGRLLATAQKEPVEVAMALEEQWMPRGEHAPLPMTQTGIFLSLLDKIDNLIGFFALGLKPSSSSDPYALRRQALGLIRILLQNKLFLPLRTVLKECMQPFPAQLIKNQEELIRELITFIKGRATPALQDLGFEKDEINACLDQTDDIYDLFLRVEALHQIRQENESFDRLIEVHKRTIGQIQGKVVSHSFTEKLFVEKEEQELATAYLQTEKLLHSVLQEKHYLKACRLLSELQPLLNALFEKVKILHEDQKIRDNRLALLQEVAKLFSRIADFQKM